MKRAHEEVDPGEVLKLRKSSVQMRIVDRNQKLIFTSDSRDSRENIIGTKGDERSSEILR
jgi:beta-lactamase superfamily II metal-dependent hydrolase